MTPTGAPHGLGVPARLFLAGLVAVGLLIGITTTASASTVPAARNVVGASVTAAAPLVGPGADVSPATRPETTLPHVKTAVATGVAANTADELGAVATHLDSIDALASHPPNAAMVDGIQDAIASGRPLSRGEQYFMTHELTEAEAVANGLTQDAAHAAALQTHPPFMNYSPEVIQRYPQYFNSNWRNTWGIG